MCAKLNVDLHNAKPLAKKVKSLSILIVEDDKPLAKALSLKLGKEGMSTFVVSNGNQALEELARNSYDVAVLDLVMPELDGFDVLQKIQEQNLPVKVIVVSNLSQDEDKEKVRSLGAVEFFVKSDTPLLTIVEYIKNTFA